MNLSSVTLWGLSDEMTWRSGDDPLVLNGDLTKKPAYDAMLLAADKKEFTEINTEPWHLRYVGIPAATYIMENGLCLEEFNDELQEAIQRYLSLGGDPEKVNPFIQTRAE